MLKPSSKVASIVVRLFIASLFLALPAITAQESQALVPVTPVASCADGGVCHVGDIGPAGGTVYYVSSGSSTFSCGPTRSSSCNTLEYIENFGPEGGPVDGSFMNSSYPDTPTSSVGTDFDIINFSSGPTADLGYGLVNTLTFYNQLNTLRGITCSNGNFGISAATTANCYSYTSSGPGNIWALPSPGEAYMLYKYLKSVTTDTNYNMGTPSVGCTPAIGYSYTQIFDNCFWTSLQSDRSVAVMDLTTGTFAFQPKLRVSGIGGNGMYKIIPVHAFLSTVTSAAPTIASATISGTVKVGQVLTATANTVTGSPTPTASYEWKAGGSVVGTDSANYTIASGDLGKTITVKITVANTVSPSATATSNPTAAVAVADTAPGITSATISGIVKVGEVLTATANGVTGSPSPTASYEWKAGATVVGTNSSTYTIASGDLGKTITVKITESNGVGSNATATSSPTVSVSSSTTSIGSSGDTFIPLAANSSTVLNSVSLTALGEAIQISGYTDSAVIKVVVTSNFGKVGISVTTGLSAVVTYPSNLSESATAIAFTGTKANLNAALNSFTYFAPTGAGNSYVLFTVTSDGFEPPLTRSLNIAVKKIQAAFEITNADLFASIDDTVTVTTRGGSGSGALSYSASRVGGGDGCSILPGTNLLTADRDTDCLVTATRAGDGEYLPITSDPVEFVFNPINQPTPITITNTKLVITKLEETITLTAIGGDGDGALTFATQSENCYIEGNTLNAIQSGPCLVIATRAPSGKYAIATSQWAAYFFVNITQEASDTFTVVVPPNLKAGDSFVLTTTLTPVGSPNEFSMEYNVAGTGCVYDAETNILSAQKVAYCSVFAFWKANAPYKYQSAPQVLIRFDLRSAPTLTIPDTYTAFVNQPLIITATGGNPDTSTVTYRVSGTGCSDATPSNNGRSITILVTQVTYCSVIASQTIDGKYDFVLSASKTIAFGKATSTKVLSVSTPLNAPKAGDRIDLSATATTPGGSDTATVTSDVDFSVFGKNCSYRASDKSLYASGLAYCTVIASWSTTSSYTYAQSSAKTIGFLTQSAPALSLPDTVTAKAGREFTLVATGGNPDLETANFDLRGPNCGSAVVDGKSVTFTPLTATACTVTVSQNATDAYNFVTFSKTYSFTFDRAPALTIANTYSGFVGVALEITADGGNPDTSTVTYKVSGTGCGIATPSNSGRSITLQPSVAAYCSIIASQAPAGRYGYVQSSPRTIEFKIAQSPDLIIDETITATAGQDLRFKARGGNGSTIRYRVSGTGCSNNTTDADGYLTITTTAVVYCTIVASQNATASLTYAQSRAKTVAFAPSDFSGDLLVTNEATVDAGTLLLSNNGGAFASQVKYYVSPTNTCIYNATAKNITTNGEAYCSVIAYWPATSIYNYKQSVSKLIHFAVYAQSEFSISNTFTSVVKGNAITVTTRGGSGTGLVSYAKKESTCSLTRNSNGTATIIATAASICSVTATKAASGKYSKSVSQTVIFTFRKS